MLKFDSVTYTYPHAAEPAVSNVSFSLAPGQAMLCTGRSGCGKSTLVRLANGLAPHCLHGSLQGNVLAAGQNTRHTQPSDLALQVGTLFQDPERQFFALNVGDELTLGLRWRGWEPERAREAALFAARLLGIESLLDQTIFGLSEGQKQKVALAALLASRPSLLVLDEPAANLDPESAAALARTLAGLKAQGVALFVVEHRLSWMAALADSVLVLEKGRVAAAGDISLLKDADLRQRHGLRDLEVADGRDALPDMRVPENQAFFACRDLSFAYPRSAPVLWRKTLSFAPGRIIALLGENGAGKTTLARLLAGLERPESGAVLVGGRTIKARRLSGVAQVVLQNAAHQLRMNSVAAELEDALPPDLAPDLAPDLPPNLRLARQGDKVHAAMERYALTPLSGRHPQSLSGGEQQRLAVACAALRLPRLLILDEPTSGLDGENMRRMADSLREIAAQGVCLLVITHDLEFINRVCTEKIVLHPYHKENDPAHADPNSTTSLH